MDKVKIKNRVTDTELFLAELVELGLLDGDQKKQILFNLTVTEISKELEADDLLPT